MHGWLSKASWSLVPVNTRGLLDRRKVRVVTIHSLVVTEPQELLFDKVESRSPADLHVRIVLESLMRGRVDQVLSSIKRGRQYFAHSHTTQVFTTSMPVPGGSKRDYHTGHWPVNRHSIWPVSTAPLDLLLAAAGSGFRLLVFR
ncbi:hypothetical protein RRG08_028991 [Elysia crispata]|uniref:Uncharacterized protein n=1 Tax=Elysia crispata TaxID=231223 RepID=A0AAE1EG99_9GAST|nr:hypothetical protein RRG08_028991 [Elysia crispata]